MSKSLSEKDKRNILTLYTLLCGDKEASVKYLNDTGKMCKTDDSSLRKKLYRKNMKEFLNSIHQF